MRDLDLTKNRETLIGGAAARITGLSGGEMKRTQFAAEVLTDPSIIFCDEPTSGLDSFMAAAIVKHLRSMANEGFRRTVVATIHQPSSQVFGLFDELIIMAQGKVAFSAPAAEAAAHFEGLGFPVPVNYNPADHFMEALSITPDDPKASRAQVDRICAHWLEGQKAIDTEAPVVAGNEQLRASQHAAQEEAAGDVELYNSSFWTQTTTLFAREMVPPPLSCSLTACFYHPSPIAELTPLPSPSSSPLLRAIRR